MNDSSANTYISAMIERARKAQSIAAQYTQEAIDRMTAIIAYEMTREVVKDELATLALEETQLGDYNSKIGKIDRSKRGFLRNKET